MSRVRGSAKVIALVIAISVVVLAMFGFGAKAVLDAAAKKSEERKADKQSTVNLIDAANNMAHGKEVGSGAQFPDTPIGHMNKLVYDVMLADQEHSLKLQQTLKDIGWDSVMTADSLRTKESVEGSLKKVGLAQAAVKEYSDWLEKAWADTITTAEAEAGKSSDGASYLQGMRDSLNKPQGGLYFARETLKVLRENHQALKDSLNFLLQHQGQYTVGPDGQLLFKEGVSQSEIDRYNGMTQRANDALDKIGKLEAERQKMVEQRVSEAKDKLK